MHFLTGKNIISSVRKLIEQNKEADLAVAFWGKDAIQLLELNAKKKLRIVCDLRSGACNPSVIEQIQKKSNWEIKTKDRLHAKVYWSKNAMIVGSANASINGLVEEDAPMTNSEAAILTTDKKMIEQGSSWFETEWKNSDDISDSDMLIARERWAERKMIVRKQKKSFLEMLATQPQWFNERPFKIIAYKNLETTSAAKKLWNKIKKERDHDDYYNVEEKRSWRVGDYIIDYCHEENDEKRTFEYCGVYRVVKIYIVDSGLKHEMLVVVKEITSWPFRHPKKERSQLAKMLTAIFKAAPHDNDGSYFDDEVEVFGKRYRKFLS